MKLLAGLWEMKEQFSRQQLVEFHLLRKMKLMEDIVLASHPTA